MKTARRHELQTNELADWLGDVLKTAEQYSRAIIASVVAVAVIAGLYAYQRYQSAAREAQLWDSYFRAYDLGGAKEMADLAEKYGETLAGQWARLNLADTELAEGTSQLFEDRAKATESLGKAVDHYQRLRKSAREPALQERATLGLARAYESQGRLEQAREEYKQLLARWPNGVYADFVQSRLADLERDSTKAFYDWFARQEKKSPVAGEPGTPGHRLPFDPGSLPAEPPDVGSSIHFGQPKPPASPPKSSAHAADDSVPVAPRD